MRPRTQEFKVKVKDLGLPAPIDRGLWGLHPEFTCYRTTKVPITMQQSRLLFLVGSTDQISPYEDFSYRVELSDYIYYADPSMRVRGWCQALRRRLRALGIPYPILHRHNGIGFEP